MTPAAAAHLDRSPSTIAGGVAADRWDKYVNARAGSSAYHLAGWARIVDRAFGHRTRYLAAEQSGAR